MTTKKFILSNQTKNFYGFIVLTAGIKMQRFEKNPVMLFNHKDDLLVGKWTGWKIDGAELTATPDCNMGSDLGKAKAQEIEAGYLNGASVRLNPIRFDSGDKYGFTADDVVLAESELIEASLCAVPNNEDALKLCDANGAMLNTDQIDQLKLSFHPNKKPIKSIMDKKMICLALGLAADSDDAAITLALQNQKNELTTLRADNQRLQQAEAASQATLTESLVQLAIDQKKITADQKEVYLSLAKTNYADTKKLLDAIKPVINLATHSTQVISDLDKGEDRSKWSFNDWANKDGNGLQLMAKSDVPRFEVLYEKQFGARP